MELSQLLESIEVLQTSGEAPAEVASVCYDSKRCEKGALFVAIPGHSRDGHEYIADAMARGAVFIVHQKDFLPPPGVKALRVADARRVLGILGRNFYGHPSAGLCLVGVMGTNGKTTVTYLLESIFRAAGYRTGVLGTVNYRYGEKVWPAPHTTPESLEFQKILREMADHGATHVIAEVSSHAAALHRVDDCAFDVGIFTNLSQDHLDFHLTMEEYFQAKLRFFREVMPRGGKKRAPRMVINGDDPWGRRILKEAGMPGLAFGLAADSDVRGEILSLRLDGTEALIHSAGGALALSSPLVGRFNLYNIMAAAAAALSLGVPEGFIRSGIAALTSVPGRLQRVSSPSEPAVFVDYAHTPDALLRVLQHLAEFRLGKIITLFGCGGDRDRGKRPLMGDIAVAYSDVTIITSDNPRGEDPLAIMAEVEGGIKPGTASRFAPEKIFAAGREKCYTLVPDRRAAIELAVLLANPGDTVLIAGKGHEDYQIVGQERFPFDDRQMAREALEAKRKVA